MLLPEGDGAAVRVALGLLFLVIMASAESGALLIPTLVKSRGQACTGLLFCIILKYTTVKRAILLADIRRIVQLAPVGELVITVPMHLVEGGLERNEFVGVPERCQGHEVQFRPEE